MRQATSLLWGAAGRPPMFGEVVGRCRVCGADDHGLSFQSWVKSTFMDWDKLMPGEIICHACQFCFADDSTVLAKRLGKDKPQLMRNYSHFVVDGEWLPLSKADRRLMADILINRAPDLAVVAMSGQKHLIFRSTPGWWQIEEHMTRPFPAQLADVLPGVEKLYNGGFNKKEIETGRYSQSRILAFGLDAWRQLETVIVRPLRGSLVLTLALFLAQKEEYDGIQGSLRDGDSTAGAPLAGHTGRLQESLPSQNLAAVRRQHQERSLHRDSQSFHQPSFFEVEHTDCR